MYKKCYLKDHILKRHSVRTECNQCGRQFDSYSARRNHMQRYHRKLNPNNKCQFCDIVLASATRLRIHMLQIHHKAKPFQCDECDFTCAHLSNLNYHRRKRHSATENLTLSSYAPDLTWEKVESMFSTPPQETQNAMNSIQEVNEISVATNEEGEIVVWENLG